MSLQRSTGTLKRPTVTKAAGGGQVNTFAAVASDVACDVQPASGRTQERYMQRQLSVSTTIYVTSDIGAKENDIFVVGSQTFKVVGWTPPAAGYRQWPGVLDCVEQPS